MSKRYLVDRSKKEGDNSSGFRSCVSPCGLYMVPGDTHDLCVVCALKELSPAFPAVLVPLVPRRSDVSTRGDCKWICWREWRWPSPYLLPHLSDSAAVHRDRRPNVSRWVLQTVERGYRIQFGSPPPRFNWVIPTLVGPEHCTHTSTELPYGARGTNC